MRGFASEVREIRNLVNIAILESLRKFHPYHFEVDFVDSEDARKLMIHGWPKIGWYQSLELFTCKLVCSPFLFLASIRAVNWNLAPTALLCSDATRGDLLQTVQLEFIVVAFKVCNFDGEEM